MFSIIKKFFTNIERYNHPKRTVDLLLELVTKLDPQVFQGIQSSDKSILQVNVPYSTIDKYKIELEHYLVCLKTATPVSLTTLQNSIEPIPIAAFFLNSKGCYIDEVVAIKEFTTTVNNFASWFQQMVDNGEKNTGVDLHNLRHLSLIIHNLYELYREFSKITTT